MAWLLRAAELLLVELRNKTGLKITDRKPFLFDAGACHMSYFSASQQFVCANVLILNILTELQAPRNWGIHVNLSAVKIIPFLLPCFVAMAR